MASNAHSNVKTFIKPDNLKAFAKSIPGKATTLATETVPNAFNKGVDTVRNPIKAAAAVDCARGPPGRKERRTQCSADAVAAPSDSPRRGASTANP